MRDAVAFLVSYLKALGSEALGRVGFLFALLDIGIGIADIRSDNIEVATWVYWSIFLGGYFLANLGLYQRQGRELTAFRQAQNDARPQIDLKVEDIDWFAYKEAYMFPDPEQPLPEVGRTAKGQLRAIELRVKLTAQNYGRTEAGLEFKPDPVRSQLPPFITVRETDKGSIEPIRGPFAFVGMDTGHPTPVAPTSFGPRPEQFWWVVKLIITEHNPEAVAHALRSTDACMLHVNYRATSPRWQNEAWQALEVRFPVARIRKFFTDDWRRIPDTNHLVALAQPHE